MGKVIGIDLGTSNTSLKTAMKEKNALTVKKEMEALTKASHKLAEEIYKHTREHQAKSPGSEKTKKTQDDIIDAEYREEDNHKKSAM